METSLGRANVDLLGVAAAQVEVVEVEGEADLFDSFEHVLVPTLLAQFVEAAAPNVVLVGLLLPGVVAELERAEMAVDVERRAHAGAEGDDHLNALALDRAIALDSGVVGHANGLLPPLLKLSLKVEVHPQGMQVDGRIGDAVLSDARKADRGTVEVPQRTDESVKGGKNGARRGHCGGFNALALAERFAGGVEQHGLETGAADVDGEGDGAGGFVGRGGGILVGVHQQKLYDNRDQGNEKAKIRESLVTS